MTVHPDTVPMIGRLSKMTCLSGGARGADSLFGKLAAQEGHEVIHWSFTGHDSPLPEEDRVILSEELLEAADPYLARAAKSINRKVPKGKLGIMNLLRRNWYQVQHTDQVIAVGNIDFRIASYGMNSRFATWNDAPSEIQIENSKGITGIQGGTAWACQMYIDTVEDYHQNKNPRTYDLTFFEQTERKILKWNFSGGYWENYPLSKSFPMIWKSDTNVYTGIGSRDLTEWGKASLMSAYSELRRLCS